MEDTAYRAIAIVGVGAVLPDAPNITAFWENVKGGRYSITEVQPDRWDPALYYDPDPSAPDKTYSKIGGWVRDYPWEPMKWHLAVPPRVVDAMDVAQKWAITCTREALDDYGYPNRPLDLDRTAVILGNAMAGEKHYLTSLRVYFPEYAKDLAASATFAALPEAIRRDITRDLHQRIARHLPAITEDSMPGELANCIAGRIANLYNFHGPNYVVDAACASAMAAISAAVEGLVQNDFDLAVTGGIDRNMGAPTFVKFCKIGALSATGTRPYAEGADGFVMGEGAGIFLLKRLADAERDGDKIYAVLRGIGGSSDGKGKGITAPNPVGQRFAIERAWHNAGLSPATVSYIEGHGTSTRVGDVVEVQSMAAVLGSVGVPHHSVALGSVKSNIGHLKGAAGAAGLLKAVLSLREKMLPPSVRCEHPNPDIDFAHSPLYVNTELRPWPTPECGARRAGLSAFGFGGTNFHAVLEEYIPHRLTGNGKRTMAVDVPPTNEAIMTAKEVSRPSASSYKAPLRGALVIGASSVSTLAERLRLLRQEADAGRAAAPTAPADSDLHASERIAIDYSDAADLATKSATALKALLSDQAPVWKALRAQGIFRGHGRTPKVAFLYTGQGSQYVNMLRPLRAIEPIVAETFAEADRVMTPLLGKPLTDFIYVDSADAAAVAKAEEDLRQTEITQPAVLATDLAMTRLLAAYGIKPDFTMGHSLGEYGALIASGALPFSDALEAVSARGRGMARVPVKDKGLMAAVFAPLSEIERLLKTIEEYVVIANINSERQAVIGGATTAVTQAVDIFQKAGYEVAMLPVSHAFHTSIVAPASEPLRDVLKRLRLESPRIPIVANLDGDFYPTGPDAVPRMWDILAQQVASPVQFVKGLRTLYDAGARVFVEVGPKKALQGFAEDVLGNKGDILSLFTNHPKFGDVPSFNQALCGLYAAGLGRGFGETLHEAAPALGSAIPSPSTKSSIPVLTVANSDPTPATSSNDDRYVELGRMFADVLESGWKVYCGRNPQESDVTVVITGAALGLPGTEHIFDDANVGRILRGEQFIDVIPSRFRHAMLDKHITRLMKSDNGGPTFETISNVADVIKLAGRGGKFDLEEEFGVSADRLPALDRVTQLAMAVGIDALRDAGIPLIMRYKTTSKGTQLPDRWGLPDAVRDDTGVIFASAFPGYDSFADDVSRYYADRNRREQLALLENLRARITAGNGHATLEPELERRCEELRDAIEKEPFLFDRRFLFRTLSMGHSQFAEFIGARGPNTAINAACASTTQAVALAEDWIRAERCRRVIVISADDVTSDHMIEWFGAGFLASGAAATDEVVEDAAIPFDRRRHGLLIGMGAAALVVENMEAARERGIRPICEVLSAVTANSAFHGTRLDVQHIAQVMEGLIVRAEARHGIRRHEIAPRTVFVSHETYTPARGGSASAEIHALRRVFGDLADQIVIANTKGFTGHAMGSGIEDVVAVKALETGCVPPVSNFKEVDPELGTLNLSKGGAYPVEYALRLGAGFGSQISMTLLRWVTQDGIRQSPNALGYAYRISDRATWENWLSRITGRPDVVLEVEHRTLRVRDQVAAAKALHSTSAIQTTITIPTSTRPPEKQAAALPTLVEPTAPSPVLSEAAREDAGTAPRKVTVATQHFAPPPAAPVDDAVKQKVLALVAEKTGYPADMLDLDLDLEADLGIDTVKQAEIFATIREAYGIRRDDNVKLRDFPTLARVIRFVHERRPDLALEHPQVVAESKQEAEIASAKSATTPVKEAPADSVHQRILALVVEKTGYPQDMLDLDLDLEADLGIDTVKQAEMFAAIREIYNIPRDENRKLRDYPTLAHVIRFVLEKRPDLAGAAPSATDTSTDISIAVHVETPKSAPMPPEEISDDDIKEKVLAIVAEKTGYPKDMLDLDLDLEADLGIDTVKQAEMFASVRAAFHIPRDAELKLHDFPTLAHVIRFARERSQAVTTTLTISSPQLPQVGSQPEKPAPSSDPVPVQFSRSVAATFDAANRIPRRVPVPFLRPPLTMCKSTGIQFGTGSRVVVMEDKAGVGGELVQRLKRLGTDVVRITDTPDAEVLIHRLKDLIANGPVHGVYWLPALDDEGTLRTIGLADWREAVRVRVKLLYATMRTFYEQISRSGTFLVCATKLGGQHGYDQSGAVLPLGGAVAGFAKAYKRERTDALVKLVDFASDYKSAEIAELLIRETLHDPGAVEIGYKESQRWTIGLQEQPAADGQPGLRLGKDTVFLITGAAGSIVSAITADLAAASGGTFYLLDLVSEPDPKNPDLDRFVHDKDGLKRDLFNRIQVRGERATPALVEKELAALERAQAARSAMDAVRAAGGIAHYFAVNLTDPEAVEKVIGEVRRRSGRIDVLLHAAGMERSHFLPDKDPHEFDLVFDVKSDGWFNLLRAIDDMPLGATVAFSSIAGRFGNAGQADYSSANDLLCKITSSFRTTRPSTRGIVIDWTAWAGIGMATRGSIPKMMEIAGIDMLPLEAGVPLIRRELTMGGTRGEIVIGERLGVLLDELDPTGGLDRTSTASRLAELGPMLGEIANLNSRTGITIETTLDPKIQPFLRDHQIDAIPLLPGVMGIEAFAEAALSMLPGWHVEAVEDVNFFAPFKFYRNQARTLAVELLVFPQGDGLVADCRLIGRRPIPHQPEGQTTTHFTGRVRLSRQAPEAMPASLDAPIVKPPTEAVIEADDIYRLYFHGPAYQVLQRAWHDGDRIIGLLKKSLHDNHTPPALPTIMAPRLIELCFQTAGLWEMSAQGRMGLPHHVKSVCIPRAPESVRGDLYAVVLWHPDSEIFDAQVVDAEGNSYVHLFGYRTVALPHTIEPERARKLRALLSREGALVA